MRHGLWIAVGSLGLAACAAPPSELPEQTETDEGQVALSDDVSLFDRELDPSELGFDVGEDWALLQEEGIQHGTIVDELGEQHNASYRSDTPLEEAADWMESQLTEPMREADGTWIKVSGTTADGKWAVASFEELQGETRIYVTVEEPTE